jgi:ATP synthase protein I
MTDRDDMGDEIGVREARKLKARRTPMRSVWAGFGFFGLIGWSVVVPTLGGAALGGWLDRSFENSDRSWTLTLLLAGLVLGCLNAWRWVAKEHLAIREEQEGDQDDHQ